MPGCRRPPGSTAAAQPLRRHGRALKCALTLVLGLLLVGSLTSAKVWASDAYGARAAHQAKPVCVPRAGASREQCPIALVAPHLYTYFVGTPLTPVLVGNTYAVDLGTWRAHGRVKFSVQWLDGRGRALARSFQLRVAPAQVGQTVTARACASVSAATSCVTLRLPQRAQAVARYLDAKCGGRRPAPPPYDANFALISAPQIAGGWNPCRAITWAIDDYAEPGLTGPVGTTWQALATNAIAQVSAATGITFVQAPDFSTAPTTGVFAIKPPPGVDLWIGFAPQAVGADGRGGPASFSGPFARSAGIELSPANWDAAAALVTLLHELGHAMGLNHPIPEPPAPDPRNEIMDPVGGSFSGYQPGDLCGLFEVTWQQPCAGALTPTLGQGTIEH